MGTLDGGGVTTSRSSREPSLSNPFENASEYADEVKVFVETQIGEIQSILDAYLASLGSVLDNLANYSISLPAFPVKPPELDLNFDYAFDIPDVPLENFGKVTPWDLGAMPVYNGPTTIPPLDIPEFVPSFTTITVPPPPLSTIGPAPSPAPTIPDYPLPDSPVLAYPDQPDLVGITVPDAPILEVPEFDPELPSFVIPPPPNVGFEWDEDSNPYNREIIDDVMNQIRIFLAGGSGIRNDVQDEMFHQAADREDRVTYQAVQEAENDFAGRGYVAPPGVMLSRIDSIRDERDRTKSSLNRDLLIKVMDAELENLRFAVQQGIQAEELFVRMWLSSMERLFRAQELTISFGLQLYNYQIAAFTAALEAVRIQALVYDTQVKAILAEVEVYKAQVDAELAKAQINESLVRMYTAEIQAMLAFVQLYEAELRAVQIQVETDAIRVRAFGEEVNAYAAEVGAEKLKFDAYDSQVRGEVSKASIIESEARAYQAQVTGLAAGTNAEARALEAGIGVYEAQIRGYVGDANAKAARSNAEASGIQANVAGYQAATSRYNAIAGLEEAMARVEASVWANGNSIQVEAYRANIAESEVNLRRVIEEARLALEGLKTAGQLSSTISGGAMAAINVGASISGSGGTSASGNLSESFSDSTSAAVSDSTDSSCSVSQSLNVGKAVEDGESIPSGPPWGECISG